MTLTRIRLLARSLVFGVLLFSTAAGWAASISCSISSANPLTLNNYDPTSGSDTTAPSGSVTVQCTNSSNSKAWTVTVSLTLATSPARNMSDGSGNNLTYDLFIDNGLTTQWNTTNSITCSVLVNTNSTASCTATYYPRIANTQDVPAGSYNNTPKGPGAPAISGTFSCSPTTPPAC